MDLGPNSWNGALVPSLVDLPKDRVNAFVPTPNPLMGVPIALAWLKKCKFVPMTIVPKRKSVVSVIVL